MKADNDTWVIMPCYNEEMHISKVIDDIHKYVSKSNLVVIDDGSKDRTFDIALGKNEHVLRHIINLGKGAALKTGAEFAVSKGAKNLIFIDSDGQHEAKEIPYFVEKLKEYDIVFGTRSFNKKMPFVFRLGNYALSQCINLLFGIRLQDTQSGYRGMTSDAYEKVKWNATDYSVESEMIANAGKAKLKYCEIPISTIYHNKYKGTTIFDGIKIMFKMVIYRIQR